MQTGNFNKLENLTPQGPLGERVYQQLRQAIFKGLFLPGEVLPEDQLTKALGASRTPVREALMRLKHEGLIQISPRKGARVTKLSADEVNSLLEAREIYETAFFDRAVKTIKRIKFKKIKDSLKEVEKNLNKEDIGSTQYEQARIEYLKIDYDFHRLLVSATDNPFWIESYNQLLDKMRAYSRHIMIKQPDLFRQTKKEHYHILDAILSEDYSEAKWFLKKHIRNFRDNVDIEMSFS